MPHLEAKNEGICKDLESRLLQLHNEQQRVIDQQQQQIHLLQNQLSLIMDQNNLNSATTTQLDDMSESNNSGVSNSSSSTSLNETDIIHNKTNQFTEKQIKEASGGYPSEIIKLNVGGKIFVTTLTTMRRSSESSMLTAMFSGRYQLEKQQWKSVSNEGDETSDYNSYFIDRDGTHFRYILNYLRGTHELQLPHKRQHLEELLEECEFYQIEGLIEGIKARLAEMNPQPSSFNKLSRYPSHKDGVQIVIVTQKDYGATIVGTTDLCFFGTVFSEQDPNFRNALRQINFASDYNINIQIPLTGMMKASLFQNLESNRFYLVATNKGEYVFKKDVLDK